MLVLALLCLAVSASSMRVGCRLGSLRMAIKDVCMPALSSTMTEGKIVSWNKKVGDKVIAGKVHTSAFTTCIIKILMHRRRSACS
jgi:hypothetical protein